MKIDASAAGFDERRLKRVGEHLVARYVEPGKIAGCQVAVLRRGQLAMFESYGSMDRERAKPVADDTIWRLYSMTKPVTGVALMTLYERGHFHLDQPVRRWIPEWKDLGVREVDEGGNERIVPATSEPTVRQILMHTAGIGYGEQNRDLDIETPSRWQPKTLEELARDLGSWPLRFQPGTRWLYSYGMDVAARLVEVISGMPFDEYLKQEIFGPLGMVDTDFWVPEDKLDRFATNYYRNPRRELVVYDDPQKSPYRRKPAMLSGGGGLVGTTPDYLRFAAMLAGGGALDGVRILSRKTVELMTTNHLPGDASLDEFALPGGYGEVGFTGAGFGLTMSVAKSPTETGVVGSPGEFMWGGAASTTFFVDPVEDLTVVFMTQLMAGLFDFRGQLKTIVYGALAD